MQLSTDESTNHPPSPEELHAKNEKKVAEMNKTKSSLIHRDGPVSSVPQSEEQLKEIEKNKVSPHAIAFTENLKKKGVETPDVWGF